MLRIHFGKHSEIATLTQCVRGMGVGEGYSFIRR